VVVSDCTCAIMLTVKVRNNPTASRIGVRMSCPVSSYLLLIWISEVLLGLTLVPPQKIPVA